MEKRFSHLKGETSFPELDTVRPYAQYRNTFDYTRWKANSRISLLNVPWTTPDDPNCHAVKFDDDAKRDAWFDAQARHSITNATEFRIQPNGEISLPVPFDVAQCYNYVMVEFGVATSETEPLPYETAGSVKRFFYFLIGTEFAAASTTRCFLRLDAWTTYVNRVTIDYMRLSRGHAPISMTTVDDYLADPLHNSAWLTYPEPDGMASALRVASAQPHVINDDVLACIVTTANLRGAWGSEAAGTWTVSSEQAYVQGAPARLVYGIATSSLAPFLDWCEDNIPQFVQTVQAVCFVGSDLLAKGAPFQLGSYALFEVAPVPSADAFDLELSKEAFAYPAAYAHLAKLYTSPYAMVRMVTSTGDAFDVAIENLGARVNVNIALSLLDPEMLISAHVNGYGAEGAHSLSFAQLDIKSRAYGGAWNEMSWRWPIPCYALTQSAAKHNDYSDFYGRVQATNDYETAYQVALRSANTAKLNADASANTSANNAKEQALTTKTNAQNSWTTAYQNAMNAAATAYQNATNSANATKTNTDNSVDAVKKNTALTVAANTALTDNAKNVSTQGVTYSNNKLESDKNYDISISTASLSADMANAAIAASNNDAKANTAVSLGGLNVLQSLGDLQIGSALFGGLQAYQNITTDWTCTNNSINVSLWSSNVLYQASFRAANGKTLNSTANNTLMTELQNSQLTYQNTTNNELLSNTTQNTLGATEGNAQNSYATALTNAGNSKSLSEQTAANDRATAETNATNSYNRAMANAQASLVTALANNERSFTLAKGNAELVRTNAKEAIANRRAQAAMGAPLTFGRTADAATGATTPLFCEWQILTQSEDAIATAGDAMLRYGYACDRVWEFNGFNVMERFTYWQVADVWISSEEGVIETARTEIKMMLYNGVTVWRDPNDVGKADIHDNRAAEIG